MRCDLHVHTVHSGMCTVPVLSRVCLESYNEPLALYEASETARHGPRHRNRSRFDRRRRRIAALSRFLPERGSHLHHAERHGNARRRLRHRRTRPHRTAAPPPTTWKACWPMPRKSLVRDRQSRLFQPRPDAAPKTISTFLHVIFMALKPSRADAGARQYVSPRDFARRFSKPVTAVAIRTRSPAWPHFTEVSGVRQCVRNSAALRRGQGVPDGESGNC